MIVVCPYCGALAEFVEDSSEFYRRDYGPLYVCRPCDARVGCHDGTRKPLGQLANKELRAAKMRAHAVFDPYWKGNGSKRGHRGRRRREAYRILANAMGIPSQECHIGMFDVTQCERAISACKKGLIEGDG